MSSASAQGSAKRHHLKGGTLLAIGGIQVFDFVSDLAVVIQWYLEDETTLGNIGLGFIIGSVLVAALGGSYYFFDPSGPMSGYSLPVKLVLLFVLPLFNLHLVFVGFTMDVTNFWQKTFFFGGKLYSTVYESLPLAVLTVYFICTSDPYMKRESTALIMLPSLSLSCLSMAYGGTGAALNESHLTGTGAALRLFSYFIVDIVWLLSGFWGLFFTKQFMVLLYILGVQLFGVLCLYVKMYPSLKKWRPETLIFFYVMQTYPFMVLDAGPKFSAVPECHWSFWPVFVIRRISLFAMSSCWITAIGGPAWSWCLLAAVFCLHTLLTIWVWSLNEDSLNVMKQCLALVLRCFPILGRCTRRPRVSMDQNNVLMINTHALPSAKSHRPKAHPCLQGLVMHASWSEEKVKRFVDVAEGVLRTSSIHKCPSARQAVEALVGFVTQEIQKSYPDMSVHALLDEPCKVLCSYEPLEKKNDWLRVDIERILEQHGMGPFLEKNACSEGIHDSEEEANELRVGQHVLTFDMDQDAGINMRALPLVHAANVWLWKSSKGNPQQYNLSQPAAECATFISHSWSDPWWIKAIMLRNHLFLMEYDSIVFIMGCVACTHALPMSFLLQSVAGTGISFLPLYIVLFSMGFATIRAHISGLLVPSTWGPWPRELGDDNSVWLDKVCIDQTNADTKQKGIANLAAYLLRCKTMTVMVGDSYFTRLWTTFELATYCRVHHDQGNLADRLSFLSLKWASTWNITWLFRPVTLDQSEWEQLATYSCLDADCYMPADRMVVLAFIRRTWGSEENFDNFVRTELPEILRKGKEEFMWRSLRTMNSVLELLF